MSASLDTPLFASGPGASGGWSGLPGLVESLGPGPPPPGFAPPRPAAGPRPGLPPPPGFGPGAGPGFGFGFLPRPDGSKSPAGASVVSARTVGPRTARHPARTQGRTEQG